MKKASKEEIAQNKLKNSNRKETDLTVSSGGTWHNRGFTSLYGVVSLIDAYTGKVIDIFVKSAYCHWCAVNKSKKGTAEYEGEYEINKESCQANHEGSAGKTEVDAVIEIFLRSAKNLGVRFMKYIGDGDSKTYSGILKAALYGKDVVKKKSALALLRIITRASTN